jgi:hypothetical protein
MHSAYYRFSNTSKEFPSRAEATAGVHFKKQTSRIPRGQRMLPSGGTPSCGLCSLKGRLVLNCISGNVVPFVIFANLRVRVFIDGLERAGRGLPAQGFDG